MALSMNAARRSTETATASGVAKHDRRAAASLEALSLPTGDLACDRALPTTASPVAVRRDRSGPREHTRRARRILGTCRPVGPTPTLARPPVPPIDGG